MFLTSCLHVETLWFVAPLSTCTSLSDAASISTATCSPVYARWKPKLSPKFCRCSTRPCPHLLSTKAVVLAAPPVVELNQS